MVEILYQKWIWWVQRFLCKACQLTLVKRGETNHVSYGIFILLFFSCSLCENWWNVKQAMFWCGNFTDITIICLSLYAFRLPQQVTTMYSRFRGRFSQEFSTQRKDKLLHIKREVKLSKTRCKNWKIYITYIEITDNEMLLLNIWACSRRTVKLPNIQQLLK